MKRRIITTLLAITLLCANATAAFATNAPRSQEVQRTTTSVTLNGSNIPCAGYNIGGNNYFKLRDLLQALDIHVAYDAATQTIHIDTAKPYVPDGSEGRPAPQTATATPTTAKMTLNGVPVNWTAYNIGGANYFKLRDVMKALDVFVYYAAEYNLILLLTDRSYEEDPLPIATPITSKTITSISHAREDFSLQANPAVFNDVYTRGIYNLIRQVILDYDIILSNADDNGFNPYYHYPHTVSQDAYLTVNRVFSYIMAHHRYRTFSEPYLTERWQHPNYVSATHLPPNQMIRDADIAAESIVAQTIGMTTAEQVRFFNDFVRSRIFYDATQRAGTLLDIFTGTTKVPGVCSNYTNAFRYLCGKAGIPVVLVCGPTAAGIRHSWSQVYVNGTWFTVDVTANIVLTSTYTIAVDENPRLTAFIKELLVPSNK